MIYKCGCGKVHDNGIDRRDFLGLSAGAVFGYALTHFVHPIEVVSADDSFRPRNTAKFCILVNLNGGPSHSDLFDVKRSGVSKDYPEVRPEDWEARMDIQQAPNANFDLPMGLLGELAQHADKLMPIRWWGWSNAHEIGQYWNYANNDRNPAFQPERPNVGAVVAAQYANVLRRRRDDDVLPGFISLNGLPYQNGFLSGKFAPFITTNPKRDGIGNIMNHPQQDGGQDRFRERWNLLQALDLDNRRQDPPLGKPAENFTSFYNATERLMYSDALEAFAFSQDDAARYTPSGNRDGKDFGNSLIVARNLASLDKGTNFVWITYGGWDMHGNIYQSLFGNNNDGRGRELSVGLGALISDLKELPSTSQPNNPNRHLIDDVLIVINGDFGRTPAARYNQRDHGLNNGRGRDHWNETGFWVFIGGGIKGGRAIGESDETGKSIIDPGWNAFDNPRVDRPRSPGSFPKAGPTARTEDCYFTMYSALGINPTYTYRGPELPPSGRPYEVVYGGTRIFGELPLWD